MLIGVCEKKLVVLSNIIFVVIDYDLYYKGSLIFFVYM